jgi:hypothetical protein
LVGSLRSRKPQMDVNGGEKLMIFNRCYHKSQSKNCILNFFIKEGEAIRQMLKGIIKYREHALHRKLGIRT